MKVEILNANAYNNIVFLFMLINKLSYFSISETEVCVSDKVLATVKV